MVHCPNCNAQSVIRTSWTTINPRRRFYCCSGSCGIINWYDPPMCPRAVQIIPDLLRSMNELQERCNELQARVDEQASKVRRLKWILGVLASAFVHRICYAFYENGICNGMPVMVFAMVNECVKEINVTIMPSILATNCQLKQGVTIQ
ncbi:hypothetical protein CTI12_AA478310 [Artemisia annua]|uniref:Zinc finger, GRF-type n=1 Tax=Artemisia annua TaxID=35608 RepID=A0A2U1LLD3_ARTAN|nr:hypothetical protein CTI12_AA478310 [Artemisia annua]